MFNKNQRELNQNIYKNPPNKKLHFGCEICDILSFYFEFWVRLSLILIKHSKVFLHGILIFYFKERKVTMRSDALISKTTSH